MSGFGFNNCYLPNPPRAWSRVQNSCPDTNEDPFLAEKIAMLNKGNVLQYKANSSNLTQSQKYSKIVKGQWVNRNTTWATQSAKGYTNPNTTSLKRSGNVINIAIDPITGAIIGPTESPITCLKPITPVNEVLPSNGGGGSDVKEPDIPPPVEPSPNSDTFPPIISDPIVEPIVIQDGGVLICSVQENICTGETKNSISQQLCHPTTDSDVPGSIQDLCWNDGTQTWFPRQRYVMSNSGNKWPTNAKLVSAIKIYPPTITSVVSSFNITTIVWTFDSSCLPATNFNIFQNGILIDIVPGNVLTLSLSVINCNYYEYYIVAVNTTALAISDPSNTVITYVSYIEPPINLIKISEKLTSITTLTSGFASVEIGWTPSSNSCGIIIGYNIYVNNILLATVSSSTTSYTITNLFTNNSYNFNVTSLATGIESSFSSTLNVSLPIIYTTTGPPLSSFSSPGYITLTYSLNGTFNFNYDLQMEYTLVGGGGGGGLWSQGNLGNPGSPGGGGGHILNTNSPRLVLKNNFTLTIGQGGLGGNNYSNPLTSIGTIGIDSSISGTDFNVSTNNALYSGQGGRGLENVAWDGGGNGGNPTNANGGTYVIGNNGTGGAGGTLTLVDSSNNIVLPATLGGTGLNNNSTSGGNGGAGHSGIDGIYGGGGGGGGANLAGMLKGIGGNGGGGNGTQSSPLENAQNGQSPGGGGGGSNNFGGAPEPQQPLPGNGANGIIIIKFTSPP